MDVSAVSAASASDPRPYSDLAGPHDRSAHASATGTSKTITDVEGQAPAPLPVKPDKSPVDDSARIKVQVTQHASGSAQTTVVDTRTGLPVLELPPERVVQAVEGILWRQRHAKDASLSTQHRGLSNGE